MDKTLRLLAASKLTPEQIILASLSLKKFVRAHRRRTHIWMIKKLGITKRKFYRFLAISKWSKKTIGLINKNTRPLSQTAIFKLADKKWKNSKALVNALKALISHLSHRKRKALGAIKKTTDHVGEHLKSMKKKLPPKYVLKVKCRFTGEEILYKTTTPGPLRKAIEEHPSLVIDAFYQEFA